MAEEDVHVPLDDQEEGTSPPSEGESDHEDSDGERSGNRPEDGYDGEDDNEANANAGWAEAMAKILEKKTSEKKSSILVKNKELEKIRGQERREQQEKKEQVNRRLQWEWVCRQKADVVKDRETEKALQRIATRGVVQLFNAVRKHQRSMEERLKDVGGSESKKAKILSSVSKKDFVQCLRGAAPTDPAHCAPVTEDKSSSWNVLKDDFMMGASMKDWDKQSDEEGAGQVGGASE